MKDIVQGIDTIASGQVAYRSIFGERKIVVKKTNGEVWVKKGDQPYIQVDEQDKAQELLGMGLGKPNSAIQK